MSGTESEKSAVLTFMNSDASIVVFTAETDVGWIVRSRGNGWSVKVVNADKIGATDGALERAIVSAGVDAIDA